MPLQYQHILVYSNRRDITCIYDVERAKVFAVNDRGVVRRLFKSRHNMSEERNLGVKATGESKVEGPCRGTGGRGGGWLIMPLGAA